MRPSQLVSAGASILREVAESRGFTRLAAFGSAARGGDRPDSDLDLLVQPPADAHVFDLLHLEDALAGIVGRGVNLISYRGLDPRVDQDILRDKALL